MTTLTDYVGNVPDRFTRYLDGVQDQLAYVVLPADAAGNVDYGYFAYDNLGDTTSTQAYLAGPDMRRYHCRIRGVRHPITTAPHPPGDMLLCALTRPTIASDRPTRRRLMRSAVRARSTPCRWWPTPGTMRTAT